MLSRFSDLFIPQDLQWRPESCWPKPQTQLQFLPERILYILLQTQDPVKAQKPQVCVKMSYTYIIEKKKYVPL